MQLASTQVFPYFRRSDRKYIIDVKRKFVFAALCQRVKVGGKQFFDLSNAVIYGVSMSIDHFGGCLYTFPVLEGFKFEERFFAVVGEDDTVAFLFEVEAEQGKIIRVVLFVIT